MTLEHLRDLVVIIYGVLGVLLFVVLIVVALGLLFAVRGLTGAVRTLLDDPVRPALDDVRQAAQNVRGATEFATDATVHPIIRVMAASRGIRRGLGVLTGIHLRRPGRRDG